MASDSNTNKISVSKIKSLNKCTSLLDRRLNSYYDILYGQEFKIDIVEIDDKLEPTLSFEFSPNDVLYNIEKHDVSDRVICALKKAKENNETIKATCCGSGWNYFHTADGNLLASGKDDTLLLFAIKKIEKSMPKIKFINSLTGLDDDSFDFLEQLSLSMPADLSDTALVAINSDECFAYSYHYVKKDKDPICISWFNDRHKNGTISAEADYNGFLVEDLDPSSFTIKDIVKSIEKKIITVAFDECDFSYLKVLFNPVLPKHEVLKYLSYDRVNIFSLNDFNTIISCILKHPKNICVIDDEIIKTIVNTYSELFYKKSDIIKPEHVLEFKKQFKLISEMKDKSDLIVTTQA